MGNLLGSRAAAKLEEAFQRSSTLETLRLEASVLSKEPRWAAVQDISGHSFTIVCSRSGVAIMARQEARMVWGQDAKQVEICFERHDLKAAEPGRGKVDFATRALKVSIDESIIFDKELWGTILPQRSSWSMRQGELSVVLKKATQATWESLTR